MSTLLRFAVAALLAGHGLAHLPGFVSAWRLATLPDLPYDTRVLAGHLDVGDGGARLLGALWLATGLAFAAAAMGVLRSQPWWEGAALAAACASLALCALEWPATRLGVPVNLAILGLLFLGPRLIGLAR